MRAEEDQEGALTTKGFLILFYLIVLVGGAIYGIFSWRGLSSKNEIKSEQANLGLSFALPVVAISSGALLVTFLWVA